MGWLFSSNWGSRKELLQHLRSKQRWGDNYEIVRSQAVGNNHWYVGKVIETGELFIGLDLMQGSRDPYEGWGYKDLDESAGPCEVNCPVGYLDLVADPGFYATAWRVKVREYAAGKKAKKALGPGSLVRYGGIEYKLRAKAYRKGAWYVTDLTSGWEYTMSGRQLAQSAIVN